MDDIPEWAMEAAQKAFDAGGLTSIVNKDAYDDVLATFARALVAERERAAMIVEAKRGSVPDWLESDMEKINAYTPVDVSRATSKVLIEQLAAAIRKGE